MFDMGFWEIITILIIALLVFGPEKLPGAARTAGLWVGRARRLVDTVKNDIDKEFRLRELQEQLQKNEVDSLHQFRDEIQTGVSELNKPISWKSDPPTQQDSSAETTESKTSDTSVDNQLGNK